eukprot:288222-Prymnesium_polylepis.1
MHTRTRKSPSPHPAATAPPTSATGVPDPPHGIAAHPPYASPCWPDQSRFQCPSRSALAGPYPLQP